MKRLLLLVIVLCACSPTAPDNAPGSWAAMCAEAKSFTQAQWLARLPELQATPVTWQGVVVDVSPKGEAFEIWLATDPDLPKAPYVFAEVATPPPVSKGQFITLSGSIVEFDNLVCNATLVNVTLQP